MPDRESAAPAPRSRTRWGAPAALVLAAALLAPGCATNPATGRSQLSLIGEQQEIAIGRQNDEQITASLGLYEDDELQAYVSELGLKLAAFSERPDLPWSFKVVDDPVVNAFALPGGFIYVTRGILAHMSSEAELVGVLGHEIGHVTARHSVERLSKAQLATIGLGVAMVASEDFRQYGGLAQAGLGLLFLQFSRDDERQSDDLGLRYLRRAGYDPNEMDDVFAALDRASRLTGAGRVPTWLATHPNPTDRVARIQQQVAQLPPEERQGEVGGPRFLGSIDGMVFGADPRQGYFIGQAFYHPELRFQLTFPDGWTTLNQRQAVRAVSPQEDAVVILTLAEGENPGAAAQSFFANNQGLEARRRQGQLYDFRTEPQVDGAGRQVGQVVRGVVSFEEVGGQVYRILGYTLDDRWNGYQQALSRAVVELRPLSDGRYLDVAPARLKTRSLGSAMDLAEFNRRYPSTVDLATLAIINGVDEGERLPAGTRLKRVVGGKLPER